ncbi:hypothetical protein [Kutzneria buriramensis]|uniref:2'-5' RNA ligase superfamily protein n=1 Tax=Kutzneria buriramensis TaxID=1045776 RepID=A0A3E0G6U1_9PSEU|nr:hypothetical protein [Kutzneria buriramensis]REH18318.1 hypothetical protein BCF44_13673 [Kutzneria buriramensis]
MRNFLRDKVWSPDGARPHVLVPVTPSVAALAAVYAGALPAWREDWAEHLQLVPPSALHVTVAWVDQPIATAPTALADLEQAVSEELTGMTAFPALVGPATVVTYGVELYVLGADDDFAELGRRCRRAVRAVFGAAAAPEPARTLPHLAIAYGRNDIDDTTLGRTLTAAAAPGQPRPVPVEMLVDQVLVADMDAFAAAGPGWSQALPVPLDHCERARADVEGQALD